MKQFYFFLIALFVCNFGFGQVIISQYYEGASNDKWIEITNIGSSTVDLASPQLYLALFTNTAADNPSSSLPSNTEILSGSITSGGTILFKNISAQLPNYASGTNSTTCNFNGDDLLILTTATGSAAWANRTDVVGNGTSWGTDTSFYRKSSITAPSTTFNENDWEEVSNATVNNALSGTSERLGEHLFSSGPNLTISPTTLTALDYIEGFGPSAPKSFVVSGSNLDLSNVTVTASTDFEVSETETGTFASLITLNAYDGTTTTFWVRLAAGKLENIYSGNVTISGGGDPTDALLSVSGEVTLPSYCNVGPTSNLDSEIENVILTGENNSINNNTTDSCTGDTGGFINDFTTLSADLEQGGSYTLTVEFGDCSNETQYDGAGGVWIDWNNDFDFDDAGEQIGTIDLAVASGNVTEDFTINVPIDQPIGTYRMRIVQEEEGDSTTISPCGTFTYGSVEDYTIEIIAPNTNDTDTEVFETIAQVTASTQIAANVSIPTNSFPVLGFIIEDQGSGDGLATEVTRMRFVPGPNNSGNWSDHIQGVTLDDLSNSYNPNVIITNNEIILEFTTPISVNDGDSIEFELGVYLNTTNIIDGAILQFQIDAATNGFLADTSGSGFIDPFTLGNIVGNNHTIDIEATQLTFVIQPSNVEINAVMMPSVEVAATDINSLIDTDYSGTGFDISLTTTGSFDTSAITTVTANNGIATFNNLIFGAESTGSTLTASDGALIDDTSGAFDVTVPQIVINFDNDANWTAGSASIGSYASDHIYSDNNWTFTGGDALRNTTSGQDGFPGALGTYSWRLRDGRTVVWTATFTADLVDSASFTKFGFDVRRWDGSPSPAYIVEYSFDGGTTWNTATDIGNNGVIDNNALGNSSDWSTFIQPISSPVGLNANQFVVRLSATTGERIMVDNFSFNEVETRTNYTFNGLTWSPSDPNLSPLIPNDNIIIESGNAIISDNIECNRVTVQPGAGLTINSGASVTLNDALRLESTSTAYSSLINDGTISGNVVYNRYVNQIGTSAGGGNDLVAPPLGGQAFDAFVAANSNLPQNGDNTQAAFAPFNNSTGAYVNFAPDATTLLEAGKGYRVATEAPGGTLAFTGTVATGNVDVNITVPGGTLGKWNLIGNPYPSYINTLAFLNHEATAGTSNAELLDENARAIYGYNGGEIGIWEIITLANAAVDAPLIAPGQGFFVAAAGDANLQFTPAMRAIGNSDDFIAGRNTPPTYLKLQATNGSATTKTDIYFNENATNALDPGYDAQTWGGQTGGFTLYSHLVAENTGVPMGLQALGMDALNNVSIPLGINAAAGTNLSFSILDAQLPAGTDVYIEDTVNNTVTQINNNAYSINLNQAINGTGRFFLRFTSGTLTIADDTAGSLNIYHDAATQHIVIAGQLTDNTTAYLYDLQGRMVSSNALEVSQPEQRVDVSSLSTGVYVLSFDNGTTRISKKLIIR